MVGLKSKTVADMTNISQVELSRFKTGKDQLRDFQVKRLDEYLDKFKDMF